MDRNVLENARKREIDQGDLVKPRVDFEMSVTIWPHKADPLGREWKVGIKRFSDLVHHRLKWDLIRRAMQVESILKQDHPLPRLPES